MGGWRFSPGRLPRPVRGHAGPCLGRQFAPGPAPSAWPPLLLSPRVRAALLPRAPGPPRPPGARGGAAPGTERPRWVGRPSACLRCPQPSAALSPPLCGLFLRDVFSRVPLFSHAGPVRGRPSAKQGGSGPWRAARPCCGLRPRFQRGKAGGALSALRSEAPCASAPRAVPAAGGAGSAPSWGSAGREQARGSEEGGPRPLTRGPSGGTTPPSSAALPRVCGVRGAL